MMLAAAALMIGFGPANVAITPQVVIPERPPIFWFHGELPCAELVGFDLTQDGNPVAGPPFRVREGAPLDLTLFWRPLCADPGDAEVGVNLRSPGVGPGPGHYRRYPIATAHWAPGTVSTQQITHALPPGKFDGDGFLNLFLTRPEATAQDWAWLYRGPAVVIPLEAWRRTNPPRPAGMARPSGP